MLRRCSCANATLAKTSVTTTARNFRFIGFSPLLPLRTSRDSVECQHGKRPEHIDDRRVPRRCPQRIAGIRRRLPAGGEVGDGETHCSCQRMVRIFHCPPRRTSWKLFTPLANGFTSSDLLRDSYGLQTCAMSP